MTPASDLTTPTQTATTYSQMTVDIFNKINLLRTTPSTEGPLYSAGAQTAVTNSYSTALSALKWS